MANIIPMIITLLLILVTLFTFSRAQDTTEYFEGLLDTTVQDELIEVTTEESVGKSSSNPYAKYIFGLPPIPVDPAIPEVESDDDFETMFPFTPDQVYNKDWFISGFDKQNRPILLKAPPRISNAAFKLYSNSTALKLFAKLARYRLYILTKAMKIKSTEEAPVKQYIKINDFINSNSYAPLIKDPTSSKWFTHIGATERRFLEKYQKTEIVLNVGVVGEVVGRIFQRVAPRRRNLQVYGPNKAEWTQALRRQFPRDQLPEEYGGFKGHVPIKLYPD